MPENTNIAINSIVAADAVLGKCLDGYRTDVALGNLEHRFTLAEPEEQLMLFLALALAMLLQAKARGRT